MHGAVGGVLQVGPKPPVLPWFLPWPWPWSTPLFFPVTHGRLRCCPKQTWEPERRGKQAFPVQLQPGLEQTWRKGDQEIQSITEQLSS